MAEVLELGRFLPNDDFVRCDGDVGMKITYKQTIAPAGRSVEESFTKNQDAPSEFDIPKAGTIQQAAMWLGTPVTMESFAYGEYDTSRCSSSQEQRRTSHSRGSSPPPIGNEWMHWSIINFKR